MYEKQSVDRNILISWLLLKLTYHSLSCDINRILFERNTLYQGQRDRHNEITFANCMSK